MIRPPVAVDFFADLSCPWCYVGWAALKQAAQSKRDAFAVSVAWRTFLLSPEMPRAGVDRLEYLSARFQPEQLAAAQQTLEAAAAAAGAEINLNAAKRLPNTIDAHRVVQWAAREGAGEGVIDALFNAYFVEGRDLGDAEVIATTAALAGMDPQETRKRLATEMDRATILNFHRAAQTLGLHGVPVAVFNRRVPLMGAQSAESYTQAIIAAGAAT